MERPTIRYGARGEHVSVLQGALNLWPKSLTPALEPDGIFGVKTHSKVQEFQRQEGTTPDGIVGPITWELMGPFIEALVGALPQPGDDDEAIERIILAAESALATFGFGGGPVRLDPLSARIAAAKCAAPNAPQRPRQGGLSLRSIFQLAGAPANYHSRCHTITKDAESMWQQSGSAATAWRNANDLPAWCGVFCYYVYRVAGLDMGGWSHHADNIFKTKVWKRILHPKQAHRGCVGVIDGIQAGGKNHHFIVTNNAGGFIDSIDGNAHGPNQAHFETNYSTIARRRYSHTELQQQDVYFLFPDFTKLNAKPAAKPTVLPNLPFRR